MILMFIRQVRIRFDAINVANPNLCKIKFIKDSKHELLLERDLIRNEVMSNIMDFLVN